MNLTQQFDCKHSGSLSLGNLLIRNISETIRNDIALGIDIGGTLIKVAWISPDDELELYHFSTENINELWKWIDESKIPVKNRSVRVTGGGAIRFQDQLMSGFQERGGLGVDKVDEIEAVVIGLNCIIEAHETLCASGEGSDSTLISKFDLEKQVLEPMTASIGSINLNDKSMSEDEEVEEAAVKEPKCGTTEPIDHQDTPATISANPSPYPYLLVNIGSGVSMIKVAGHDEKERITGTCLGGGTALGIAHVCSGVTTFKELLDLSAMGSPWLDLTVGDLQGDAAGSDRLPVDAIASSFGRLYVMGNLGDDTLSDVGRGEEHRVAKKHLGVIEDTSTMDHNRITFNGSNYQNKDEGDSSCTLNGDVNSSNSAIGVISSGNLISTSPTGFVSDPQSLPTSSHSEEDISRLRHGLLKDVRHLEWEEEEGCEEEVSDTEGGGYVGSLQYKRDIAYSVVKMVSYNLGYLAYLVSHIAKCDRIFFTGKFVAAHPLTLHSLTYALDFCATNSYAGKSLRVQPYFSNNYDGYIGAIGSLFRE